MGSRFQPAAAEELRAAIRDNGGNEVFAIGDVDGGQVCGVTVTCRGQADRVTALLDRPRAGQVVIHNHPSGDLTPSDPDMQLAGHYGEGGVGVVIVDNQVSRANWIVEPHDAARVDVPPDQVRAFFEERLPPAIPGYEAREQQVQMALAVTAALNDGRVLLAEAGTGTGKSLAYLVPAALWAIANEDRVVVSTFTRTLQGQLQDADVPTLRRAGLDVRVQLLQGRNNYLCRRRLALAAEDAGAEDDARAVLDALVAWSETTQDGSRLDLPVDVDAELWGRVRSDAEVTLRARCPHFATCHYYQATRRAAGAHVILVNHALLLADLSLRATLGRGILPSYTRVILDEGHHLEDAATGVSSEQVTHEAVRQAVQPLLDRPRRRGALGRLARDHLTGASALRPDDADRLAMLLPMAQEAGQDAMQSAEDGLTSAVELLRGKPALRVLPELEQSAGWRGELDPTLRHVAHQLDEAADRLQEVEDMLSEIHLPAAKMEPLLQVRRSRRRLQGLADRTRSFLVGDDEHARWLEIARRRRGAPAAVALMRSPIDVAATLQQILWSPMQAVVATSATMTTAGSFGHFRARCGLAVADELTLPSPFDHFTQAILGLPRDLVAPNAPDFLDQSARLIIQAVRASRGGAFVLCTSYAAVRSYAAALRAAGVGPLLVQGEGERTTLLQRFLASRSSVLIGTDSFWEGVSVKGDALRLVILARMPFRVPTDPLYAARLDAIRARGDDPFRTYSLPEAILKLRQGYGRLIRSTTDRGVVLLLDARVTQRPYGRVVLASLPPARRVRGPTAWVLSETARFLDQNSGS